MNTFSNRWFLPGLTAALLVGSLLLIPGGILAQDAGPSGDVAPTTVTPDAAARAANAADGDQPVQEDQGISLFKLVFVQGGYFMYPIFLLSLLVLTFTIERAISLRREKVIPQKLIDGLSRLGMTGGFDPREAYKLCQQYPSPASNTIKTMLLKVGRPHAEVELAVKETTEREAEKLYSNVRYIVLSAGIAPLLGLLGTVWGMIQAFRTMTMLLPGENKADKLGEGIYEALVTTLGGLVVGILAAVIGHLFEGRIQKLFRDIQEMMFSLLPQIERYEGRVRFTRQSAEEPGEMTPAAPPAPEPAPAAK